MATGIAVMTIFFVIMLLVFSPFWAPKAASWIKHKTVSVDPVVQIVIDTLAIQEGWSYETYVLTHQTGISIWVSGGQSSLGLSIGTGMVSPRSLGGGDYKIDDVQATHLWPHVKRLLDEIQAQAMSKKVKAFAERSKGYADNVVAMRGRK